MISINNILKYFSDNCISKSFKEISKDNDDNYLTERIHYAFWFDEIVRKGFSNCDDTEVKGFSSCDGMFISKQSNTIYLIEFKNQPCQKKDGNPPKGINNNLKLKAIDSLIFLYIKLKNEDIISNRLEFHNINKKLIIVYSEEKTNNTVDNSHRARVLSSMDYKFQVQNYEDYLYDKVIVIPNTEFENYEFK